MRFKIAPFQAWRINILRHGGCEADVVSTALSMKQKEPAEKEKKPDMQKRPKRKGKEISYLVPGRPPMLLRPPQSFYAGKPVPVSRSCYVQD